MIRRIAAGLLALGLLCGSAGAAEAGLPAEGFCTPESLQEVQFPDVPETAPYRDAVACAALRGLLGGTEEGLFLPSGLTTRAHVLTAMYRLERSRHPDGPEPSETVLSVFSDVESGSFYGPAVAWAVENGVSRGFEDGTFRPRQLINRRQLALLLQAYALKEGASPELTGSPADYWDGPGDPAMLWAVDKGLLPCVVRELRPDFPVSRAQLAQAMTAVEALLTEDPVLTDVTERQRQPVFAPVAHEALQAAVDRAAWSYHAMGVQVAVVEKGTVSDRFSGGWATRWGDGDYFRANAPDAAAVGVPMTAGHKLRVASLTKVVVGMTAMAMQQRGHIDPDASIGRWWDGAPARNPACPDRPITVRSLLTHTSTLPQLESTDATDAEIRQRLSTGKGFSRGCPGSLSAWGYNNYGYGVLGTTLERAENRTLDEIAGEYLLDPLGMDASFCSGNVKAKWSLATLYAGEQVTRSVQEQHTLTTPGAPGSDGRFFAGGFTASATDMGKLTAVLASDGSFEGRSVLWPSMVQAMETSCGTVTRQGWPFEQCLTLRRQEGLYGRDSLYYHTGSAYGVYNFLSYDPATGDGVVVLTTGASGAKDQRGIYAVCSAIAREVYQTLASGREAAENQAYFT